MMHSYGVKHHSKYLVIIFYGDKSLSNTTRLSISISKKYGNAVMRNLCKRRLREIIREVKSQLALGDYLLIIRPNLALLDYQTLRNLIQRELITINHK